MLRISAAKQDMLIFYKNHLHEQSYYGVYDLQSSKCLNFWKPEFFQKKDDTYIKRIQAGENDKEHYAIVFIACPNVGLYKDYINNISDDLNERGYYGSYQ